MTTANPTVTTNCAFDGNSEAKSLVVRAVQLRMDAVKHLYGDKTPESWIVVDAATNAASEIAAFRGHGAFNPKLAGSHGALGIPAWMFGLARYLTLYAGSTDVCEWSVKWMDAIPVGADVNLAAPKILLGIHDLLKAELTEKESEVILDLLSKASAALSPALAQYAESLKTTYTSGYIQLFGSAISMIINDRGPEAVLDIRGLINTIPFNKDNGVVAEDAVAQIVLGALSDLRGEIVHKG